MIKKTISVFHSVADYIKLQINQVQKDAKKLQEYQKQQQLLQEKQFLDSCILEMMDRIQFDLYEAFASHDYGLSPIHVASSIRIKNYRCSNGKFYYIFSLDKKSNEKIPACMLQNICIKMNEDISCAYRSLCYSLYPDILAYNHPFLSTGIRICDIKDQGHYHVYLIVETAITPDIYMQNYRHFPNIT